MVKQFENITNNLFISHKLGDLKKKIAEFQAEATQLEISYVSTKKNCMKYLENVARDVSTQVQLARYREEIERKLTKNRKEEILLKVPYSKAYNRKKKLF
ncbi:uncharacterized protein DS421_19g658700 [Arachis hypogaea]|uniref:Uncharacterized protein n=1 Tax=Arachis hypogaea TaxID=3818 RepID=A0A6B9VA85_ARAHY|nr:uncharacterized protein DS421_19g658700 [Arachis hypogaea]